MFLAQGDCLEVMDDLIDKGIKVDAIITDPPYGTTRCKWDSEIPFDEMWNRVNNLIKKNGATVLFGNEPFSSALRMSNINHYKYDWKWKKPFPTGFLNSNYRPLLIYEDIIVFSKSGAGAGSKNNCMNYFPQGLVEVNKVKTNKSNTRGKHIHETNNVGENNCINSNKTYITKYKGYPSNIVEFSRDAPSLHPTQKPIALMEYLIKTYTNEGETVLDFTMGSGTTGVACLNTERNFIGIELEEKYYKIAEDRINKAIRERV